MSTRPFLEYISLHIDRLEPSNSPHSLCSPQNRGGHWFLGHREQIRSSLCGTILPSYFPPFSQGLTDPPFHLFSPVQAESTADDEAFAEIAAITGRKCRFSFFFLSFAMAFVVVFHPFFFVAFHFSECCSLRLREPKGPRSGPGTRYFHFRQEA